MNRFTVLCKQQKFNTRWINISIEKIKCREYNACKNSCLGFDLLLDKKCNKEFNFDIPKKFVKIQRKDHINISWNECPRCRCSIGYRPDLKDYKCERCGQKILWE